MKGETKVWLTYAEDNLKAARLLLKQSLYNPCLQNVQQCIEKGLKALCLKELVGIVKPMQLLSWCTCWSRKES